MSHLKQFVCVITTLIVLSFQFSCVKEVDNFPDFPITLTVKDSLGGVKLNWNKIETSDFIEYVIVRSTKDSIPNFSDLATAEGVFIIGRISDAKRSNFFDFNNNSILVKTYYRVFARLANRNISSPNYQLNSDIVQINVQPSDIIQDENMPERFYMTSNNTGQLVSYDANKEQILASIQSLAFSSPRMALYNNGTDNSDLIIWAPGSSRFFVYGSKTLKLNGEVNLTQAITALTTTPDGYVVAYTEDFTNPIKMIRISDRQLVSAIRNNSNVFISSGAVMKNNGTKKEIIVHTGSTCGATICKITYGDQGQLINMALTGSVSSNSCVNTPVLKVSKTGKYTIINRNLYNDQLSLNTPLQILNNSANDFFFNSSEDKIYILRPSFNGINSVFLDEMTISDGTINKTYQSRIPSFKTFVSNDKAYIFSISFSNQGIPITALQKLKL